jgi:hypothetical protein
MTKFARKAAPTTRPRLQPPAALAPRRASAPAPVRAACGPAPAPRARTPGPRARACAP